MLSRRSIARRVLCQQLCGIQDCPMQLSEIAELDVERLDGAGRLWEAAIAGRRLPNLAKLRGYGFVVDVAMVRGVDLRGLRCRRRDCSARLHHG